MMVKMRAIFLFVALFSNCFLFSGAKPLPVTTEQPKENTVYPVAIIGAGAAGTMAAKRAVLNNRQVLLFTGEKQEQKRSRGNWVKKVDNVPGLEKYTRTLVQLRNETIQDIVNGPFGKNLFAVEGSISSIEKHADLFKLYDKTGKVYLARFVIMATGIMDEQPHINGSIRPILKYANAQTVAYCLLCDGHRSFQKNVVVIGYSDDAAKSAIILKERYEPRKVTILTNGKQHTIESETKALLDKYNIDIVEEDIVEILGEDGQLKGFKLKSSKVVPTTIGFVSLGIRPNNELALKIGAKVDEQGLVLSDSSGETSVGNLFVIGDLRANSPKQIYIAWAHAVEALQVIDRRIREEQRKDK